MSNHLRQLESLLSRAVEQHILDDDRATRLRALAREEHARKGTLHLSAVLGWLGAGVATLGAILLVLSNWNAIPDVAKIAGLLTLLATAHGLALWRSTGKGDVSPTTEALHLLGAGLFLAVVGLISHVYQLDDRPSLALALWLAAIAPLAILLRSGPITVLTTLGLLAWVATEAGRSASPLAMPDGMAFGVTPLLGLGAAAVGFGARLRTAEPVVARALLATGATMLFGGFYMLGFYRHFSEIEAVGFVPLAWGCLALGVLALAVGRRHLAPNAPQLRAQLLVLMGLVLATGAAALAIDSGLLPSGETPASLGAGQVPLGVWLVTCTAWVVWFVLSLWCVSLGTHSHRSTMLNVGVVGVGLGVITHFFDLIGDLANTGVIFLVGGLALLGTGWATERWRRNLLQGMGRPS